MQTFISSGGMFPDISSAAATPPLPSWSTGKVGGAAPPGFSKLAWPLEGIGAFPPAPDPQEELCQRKVCKYLQEETLLVAIIPWLLLDYFSPRVAVFAPGEKAWMFALLVFTGRMPILPVETERLTWPKGKPFESPYSELDYYSTTKKHSTFRFKDAKWYLLSV